MTAKRSETSPSLTAKEVRDYLKSHPEFLKNNLDLMENVTPPERALGDGIVDFQHFMLKHLQKDKSDLKTRYEMLVDFCRENMSVQSQVHNAALKLIAAKNLEQLLEILTIDLVSVFDVDVVRLGIESEIPMDTSYGEEHYSGIVFIAPDAIDNAMGEGKSVLLVEETLGANGPGFLDLFSELFIDCDNLIASCALLRLELETLEKNVLLAFGVRHKDRFHSGQGIELLQFLAEIIAHQLDKYLSDLTA